MTAWPDAASAVSTRTYCRICEAACGLVADLDAGGSVARLRPDRDHPGTLGFGCVKGTRFGELGAHPERLREPQRRDPHGQLRAVSWDRAMALAGARLRPILDRHGPDAIGVYWGNPAAFNALGLAALVAFCRALDSRNVFSAGSQDCNNKFSGATIVHGSPFIHPIADVERSDLVLLLGTNPLVSQGGFLHLPGGSTAFDRLRARGGRVVLVDPRRTESADRWGGHLGIRPGTDVWLLLGLLGLLAHRASPDPRVAGLDALVSLARSISLDRVVRITGIPEGAIRDLAQALDRAQSASLHMSVGVNQGPFGTLCYVLVHALAHVTGNLDRAGGLLFHPAAPLATRLAQAAGLGTRLRRSRIGGFPSVLDTLPGGILADEILTPGPDRIRALIVLAGDPLRSIPGEARLREALGALDCLIVVDLFETATGRLADLLLPTPTWLERWDVATLPALTQAGDLLSMSPPVVAPPPGVRSEARILAELSLALGRPLLGSAPVTRAMASLSGNSALGRLTRGLRRLDWVDPRLAHGIPFPRPAPGTYLGRGPCTPEHRLRLWHSTLAPEAARLAAVEAELLAETRPYRLIGRRRRRGHNGWLHGGRHDGAADGAAWLSPEDAAALGLAAGGAIRVETDAGIADLPARAMEGVPPGTVVVPHGLTDRNVNALLPSGALYIEPASGQHRMTGLPASVRLAT